MIERKSKKISLFNKELSLHERDAQDVLNLNEWITNEKADSKTAIIFHAAMVSDALKDNHRTLTGLKIFKKWQLKRITSINYLMRKLSMSELNALSEQVYKLEGVDVDAQKKKKSIKKTKI